MPKLKTFLLNLLKIVFPTNWKEAFIFIFFLIFYGILAFNLATHYTIIFHDTINVDIYYNFDNRSILFNGGNVYRHPFSKYILFLHLKNLAFFLSGGGYNEVLRIVVGMASTLTISLGLLQIFKYLQNIVQLPIGISTLLMIFTGLFGTCIILSFTPETFAYSFFILSLFCYYSAKKIKLHEKLSVFDLTIFSIIIGGITITNLVKVYVPILFEKVQFSFKYLVRKTLIPIGVFLFLLFIRLLKYDVTSFFVDNINFFNSFRGKSWNSTQSKSDLQLIVDKFFGANILTPSYKVVNSTWLNIQYKSLFVDTYDNIFCYIFLLLFFGLIMWSIIKNRKNRLVLLLASIFFVDVLIHCLLKFGIDDLSIYGGHFVFIYPLLLGWLLQSYRHSKKKYTFLLIILIVLTVFLGYNNFLRMQDFYDFINNFYKV